MEEHLRSGTNEFVENTMEVKDTAEEAKGICIEDEEEEVGEEGEREGGKKRGGEKSARRSLKVTKGSPAFARAFAPASPHLVDSTRMTVWFFVSVTQGLVVLKLFHHSLLFVGGVVLFLDYQSVLEIFNQAKFEDRVNGDDGRLGSGGRSPDRIRV